MTVRFCGWRPVRRATPSGMQGKESPASSNDPLTPPVPMHGI
jgi:hypothetical protein